MVAWIPRCTIACVIVLAGVTGAAHAQDASAWAKDVHSSLRLLAGSRAGAVLMGAIEIQLQPGWKTYWRTPGDSGVPPRFDFSKSVNVENVMPLFPAPKTFDDGAGGVSYGYQKGVVIPLRIVPKNPNEPVVLRASISYGVCEKICVPVEAEVELSFASAASTQDGLVTAALNKVPKPVSTSDGTPLGLRTFKREGDRVIIDIAAQNPLGLIVFAEGPTPDWALPLPKQIASPEHGVVRFAFQLDGLPPNTTAPGSALKLTVVGADGAFEYNVRLN